MLYFVAVAFFVLMLIFSAWLYFFRSRQKLFFAAEKAKYDALFSRHESLKQKLNPHFFFNSLNTLAYIIEEDGHEAVKYVHEFAGLYRYILQAEKSLYVPLSKEISFAEKYMYLQKMRFGEALNWRLNITEAERNLPVPHLSLHILLEDALKQNIISLAKPLNIIIFIEDGRFCYALENTVTSICA